VVKAILVIALLASGCFDDRYKCKVDADCDLALGGRCELDQFCTLPAPSEQCDSGRRYSHAGENGSSCFDDSRTLANPCAGGQAPARAEGCFADVCERAPSCCSIAWTDTCVQLAQELCPGLRCDTRLAITATRNTTNELWEANWNGESWQVHKHTDVLPPFQWVGPAPVDPQGEPRLAGYTGTHRMVVGPMWIELPDDRTPTSITSINFDRDRRDTIVIGSVNGSNAGHRLDIVKPATDTFRSLEVGASSNVVWGDIDRDTLVDAVTRTANTNQYQFVVNRPDANQVRELQTTTLANPGGGVTDNAPQVRSYEWMDLDGDKQLDLVMFGSEIRVHTDKRTLVETPEVRADCTPPSTALTCASDGEPNLEAQSFCGTTRPTKAASELVISSFPGRKLYRAEYSGGILMAYPVPFPGDDCTCTKTCTGACPLNPCTCTYGCSTCIPIAALVARDLDGDNQLDLVAIDAKLNLYHSLAPFTKWVGPVTMTTGPINPEGFISVTASVSGARL
jgi:hypothetical protein